MKIETQAVHAGDRKRDPNSPGAFVPVTTPIFTAASYAYASAAKKDFVTRATIIRPMPRSKSWWLRSKAGMARWHVRPA
jgi:hypothetical protein